MTISQILNVTPPTQGKQSSSKQVSASHEGDRTTFGDALKHADQALQKGDKVDEKGDDGLISLKDKLILDDKDGKESIDTDKMVVESHMMVHINDGKKNQASHQAQENSLARIDVSSPSRVASDLTIRANITDVPLNADRDAKSTHQLKSEITEKIDAKSENITDFASNNARFTIAGSMLSTIVPAQRTQLNAVSTSGRIDKSDRANEAGKAKTNGTHGTSNKASVLKSGVDPDAFIRHLGQSIQVAQNLGIDPAARHGAKMQSSGFHETNVRFDMSMTGAATQSVPTGPGLTAASNGLPVYTVATHVEHEGWARAMSQQVISFMRRDDGEQMAQLRLDPPELGPIRVSIAMSDGVAHAVFGSANAQVRHLIEQAIPELARSLSEAGISLGQADVNEGETNAAQFAHSEKENQSKTGATAHAEQGGSEDAPSSTSNNMASNTHHGLVNTFA